MSGSDLKVLNKMYSNIERPYANVDLSTIGSWEIVMKIMEQQALEARRQISKYSSTQDSFVPKSITNYEYLSSSYNGNNSAEDNSDVSSCCSDEMMSDDSPATSSDSSDSDIEIDVDSIDDESDEEFPQTIEIPLTVLQLENQLREKEHSN
jgi:hypothetical protein